MSTNIHILDAVDAPIERTCLHAEKSRPKSISNVVGESPAWIAVLNEIEILSYAPSSATVLLTGETGTGKEVVSRAIHDSSDRAGKPFVAINCAAVPAELLESVLFGHEKGAFTGAYARSPGKFEQADGGTLLLDEIGEMPLSMQAKLLRVLQERKIDRVGGRDSVPVDVRIIAATHRDLQERILKKQFREDLYYRLNVYPIELPALRDRKEDIPLLVKHFTRELRKRGYPELSFTDEAMAALQACAWPGNVRELVNLVERMAVQALQREKREVAFNDLPETLKKQSSKTVLPDVLVGGDSARLPQGRTLSQHLENIEREIISTTLRAVGGNLSRAARELGMPRTTLLSRMQSLKLDKERCVHGG
ncbi:sigma-54 interaction domain-containing protein [Acidithiobacillus caldus]|uniref:sigma-54 interaction domain-containing protein n=1 Tax=Acidithiobacillus caldus TaxID=33059 RepID=UPI0001B11237|nr:sigma 54-interacting transcriptional regulator [Acidithiobacillus caldus]MBU2729955.1 sigma 54-interacting transcriptional regulator [Acidithiobacillus caldus]MBU2734189.1 sigma 54-interacting transcriptional regulator [Acidithiobacillus caldus ATCC 51756]MBU2745136.1 sigma 54-interacting transcriptional regulator [Acidithiobacillus caldus]MBU2779924.1 sigma 54-interacting transcriptional regulator [Acidithiobacillus caldus]